MKRFWDNATVSQEAAGYAILLDGRPMRLLGGMALTIAAAPLARAIAAEWQAAGGAKGGEMRFSDTPLTRLAGTAQERIRPNLVPVIDTIAGYGETDLLCYRAAAPEALVARQAREWQPWLDWSALQFDAPLRVTAGIRHVAQNRQALAALHAAVARHDALVLAGLGVAVPALGSLVLGLALADGALDAVSAHALGMLDELFQEEFWGTDTEGLSRRAAVAEDIAIAARFMALAQGRGRADERQARGHHRPRPARRLSRLDGGGSHRARPVRLGTQSDRWCGGGAGGRPDASGGGIAAPLPPRPAPRRSERDHRRTGRAAGFS